MSNTTERMELCEAILTLIERKRAETGDVGLGSAIENYILEMQVRELEKEIFENPGAIEPWLIRLRRGEA
jgi:hypothetical protein